MAKANKPSAASTGKNKPARISKFTRASLVALSDAAVSAEVKVDFTSGIGQLTAVLFRKGVLINMQSISTSGVIKFSEVQSRDSVAVNGVCSGDATITVSVPTKPVTPESFSKEIIMSGYTIL